jgi:hypothetical protein
MQGWSALDAWRPPAFIALGVDALRVVPASCAIRLRRRRDPLGRQGIERQATAMLTLYDMRQQRRDHSASKLGRRDCRLPAVPYDAGKSQGNPRSERFDTECWLHLAQPPGVGRRQ